MTRRVRTRWGDRHNFLNAVQLMLEGRVVRESRAVRRRGEGAMRKQRGKAIFYQVNAWVGGGQW